MHQPLILRFTTIAIQPQAREVLDPIGPFDATFDKLSLTFSIRPHRRVHIAYKRQLGLLILVHQAAQEALPIVVIIAHIVLVEAHLHLHEVVCIGAGGAFLIQREHLVQIVLIEQMPRARRKEEPPHIPVLNASIVQDTELRDKVPSIGVMFNMPQHLRPHAPPKALPLRLRSLTQPLMPILRRRIIQIRIIKVIRRIPKGIHLQPPQRITAQLSKEPIEDKPAFDAALGVQDEDDLFDGGVEEGFFDGGVGFAHVLGGVGEVALEEALQEVEDYARGAVVDADDGAAEGEGEAVDVGLEPGAT